jgi:hypothetical protein
LNSTVSGQGPVAGYCECGCEISSSCAAELVSVMENCWVFCEEQTEFLCYLDHRLVKMVLHSCSTDLLGSSLTVK